MLGELYGDGVTGAIRRSCRPFFATRWDVGLPLVRDADVPWKERQQGSTVWEGRSPRVVRFLDDCELRRSLGHHVG